MADTQTAQAEYYFHEGTNYESYRYFGCHERDGEGEYTYTFRTWAPAARAVSVVGDFCGWDRGLPMERVTGHGVWEAHYTAKRPLYGQCYKYRVEGAHGAVHLKGDPYAFCSKGGADGATVILAPSEFAWEDAAWFDHRRATVCPGKGGYLSAPLSIYEVHLPSFDRREDGSYYSYRELADRLVPYAKAMGYTHIELLPITEYPYDASWGYQVCAYFAPTSRLGHPDDFRYFVNRCHSVGLGVLLDWVPAHFPKDEWGLYEFDGAPLYEYQSENRREARAWGTCFFDLGRREVQSFLISSAFFWLREFHVDGLRVDAVASMLYLDYDRGPGEWTPNVYGTNINLEATAFLQKLNTAVFAAFPDVLMVAEESTAFAGVTHPVSEGGLGFNLKWNMGFSNDLFRYCQTDPLYRRYHHTALNFPILYAFTENYVLPISHDEVVYGKRSFADKMFGSIPDKLRQARAVLLFITTFPGKKLTFMGTEIAQISEWNYDGALDWSLLDFPHHAAFRDYVAALNHFYLRSPCLWEQDFRPAGFSWIEADAADGNYVAYRRHAADGRELIVIVNFAGVDHQGIPIPAAEGDRYRTVFTSCDAGEYCAEYQARREVDGVRARVTLPPFSGVVLQKAEQILPLSAPGYGEVPQQ